MSGQLSGIYAASKQQVSNGKTPASSHVYSFPVTLVSNASIDLDLRPLVYQKRLENVQGVFIDNSANTGSLLVSTKAMVSPIIFPPNSQGILPLYMSADMVLSVESAGANATINLTLLDFPTPAAVWQCSSLPVSVSGTVNVADTVAEGYLQNLQNGVTLTSGSVTGSVVNVSTPLFAANAARKYLYIGSAYNVAGAAFHDIWVNLVGGAASVGGADCIPILGGSYYESANHVTTAAINYIDALGGNNITAFQG